MSSHKVAILICSFDGAEDLWEPLAQTYKTYWPDCPYKIYLGTNFKNPNINIFNNLIIGNEFSWSDNISKCIKEIEEEFVILIFDDVFLYKKINTKTVVRFTNQAVKKNWDYLRLSPRPRYDEKIGENIGKIYKNRLYRTSTAWSLFKKKTLLKLLDISESAWDFEIDGSKRSDKYENFYSINTTILPYLNGVVKGKWVRKVFNHLQKNGFNVSDENIKKMSFFETFKYQLIKVRSILFETLVPNSLRLNIRKLFL